MDSLKLFAVCDVNCAPWRLRWDNGDDHYSTSLKEIPSDIVFFALGNWRSAKDGVEICIDVCGEKSTLGTLSPRQQSVVCKVPHDMIFLDGGKGCRLIASNQTSDTTGMLQSSTELEKHETLQEELENTPQPLIDDMSGTAVKSPPKNRRKRKQDMDLTPTVREPQRRKRQPKNRTLTDMFANIRQKNQMDLENKENEIPTTFHINTTSLVNVTQTNEMVMEKLDHKGPVPSARWGHSLCLTTDGQAVLIGGQSSRQQLAKDSCWILDTASKMWTERETAYCGSGANPKTRVGHSATYNSALKCLYVFGGSKHKKWFSEVHVLDCVEWTWQKAEVNGIAPHRAYHSATLYRYELWIFGGVYPNPDPQPDGCSNDIQIYSPMEQNWYQPIVMGNKPAARSGHSATLVGDQLVVFGGWDAPMCYNDLHVLDMMFVEWKVLDATGTPPSARCWHASCALPGKRVVISGGYNGDEALQDTFILDISTNCWMSIDCRPSLTARAGHTALCVSADNFSTEEEEVFVFGGGDNDGAFFSDSFKLVMKCT